MHGVGQAGEGPQTSNWATVIAMMAARRWLVATPDKIPHYINGQKRGATDTTNDFAQLGSYEDAKAFVASHPGWMLGFALGPDGNGGYWQGIDMDHVQRNNLADLANSAPGYVEFSPSGEGVHAIGYGQPFDTLGSNESGLEAYAGGRYFTVTERAIRDGGLVCLASFVAQDIAPRYGLARASAQSEGFESVPVDEATKRDLRSALMSMRSDDYHLWIRMGIALRELGDVGRGLWMEWSSTSEKFNAAQAARKWVGFRPSDTGYQAVFAEAQRNEWLNPGSSVAQAKESSPSQDGEALLARLSVNWEGNDEAEVPDIVEGLVADEEVTLLGGHGGIGKSFLAMQLACAVATGREVLYHDTRRCRVLYYSAEDGSKRLTRRLRTLVEHEGFDAQLLRQNLCVLDASEVEPLYGETVKQEEGKRATFVKLLGPRADFRNLQKMVEKFGADLVVIDGASDTFDGNEIARREVRAFVKMLRQVHPARPVAVLLNVHIDRSSARGFNTNDDGYAGSAAWHNSCRRRLFLQQEVRREFDEDTRQVTMVPADIVLRVMKNQDGPPEPDMTLERGMHGLWRIASDLSAITGVQKDEADHGPAILRLIAEYYERNKFMSTSLAPQATTGVYAMLKSDPGFPAGLKRARTNEMVRQLERDGLLIAEEYKRGNRAVGERWAVARAPADAN